jgi:hypothetical protein
MSRVSLCHLTPNTTNAMLGFDRLTHHPAPELVEGPPTQGDINAATVVPLVFVQVQAFVVIDVAQEEAKVFLRPQGIESEGTSQLVGPFVLLR